MANMRVVQKEGNTLGALETSEATADIAWGLVLQVLQLAGSVLQRVLQRFCDQGRPACILQFLQIFL